jgi:hypothetical protein
MKNLILLLVLILTVTLSTTSFADSTSLDSLGRYSIQKVEIKQMLGSMKQQGLITNQQYEDAIKDLESKNDADIERLKHKAVGTIKSNPSLMQNPFQGL